jgi:hypothetical protein
VYYLTTAAQGLVGVGGWIGELVNSIGELVNPNLLNLQLSLTKSTKSSLLQSEKKNKEIMLKLRYSQKATKF